VEYDAGTILGVQWYVGKGEPKDGDTEFHHRSGGDYAFRSCGSPFPMYLWTLGVSAQKKTQYLGEGRRMGFRRDGTQGQASHRKGHSKRQRHEIPPQKWGRFRGFIFRCTLCDVSLVAGCDL